MGKLPYFQFYPGDWIKDPELSRCSLAARGALMDILCLMWQCEKRGVLSSKGKPWTKDDVALAVRGERQQVLSCITELLNKGALHQAQSGAIYSRRMVRDEEQRADWRKDQLAHRERMSGRCQEDVRSMSGPSSSSDTDTSNSTLSQDAKRVASHGPNKRGWVNPDDERRNKTRDALNRVFPESEKVARHLGGNVPKKLTK